MTFVQDIIRRVNRNPVLLATATVWVIETYEASDPLTWQGAITLAVGFLVRSQVVPKKEADLIADLAYDLIEEIDMAYKANPKV